jgi:AcrR family transcriptional regulator
MKLNLRGASVPPPSETTDPQDPPDLNADPAPRGPGRPRDARHDEAILAATLDILKDEGYGGLTIERVATRAGVGRPTIYRRWRSKAALVVAALVQSSRLAMPEPDTGSLRDDLIALQRHQVELMTGADTRRVTAGLIADLATDPELAEIYVTRYLSPRREIVWDVLQRGADRGELERDVDFAFVYDLLVGPLFMRAVVWGQPLAPDAAERTTDVVLAAFASKRTKRRSASSG